MIGGNLPFLSLHMSLDQPARVACATTTAFFHAFLVALVGILTLLPAKLVKLVFDAFTHRWILTRTVFIALLTLFQPFATAICFRALLRAECVIAYFLAAASRNSW